MIAVSAPPRVRDRLLGAPDGVVAVLHRGPHAVYVDLDDGCLGILAADAVRVPCAMRTRLPVLPEVVEARLERGVLHLDGVPVLIGRLVDTRVPTLRQHRLGPLRVGVDELVGAGDGLTPYGDDVLCGWLAVYRAAGRATVEVDAAVRGLRHRTTSLSAALLECALHGEVIPEFAAYLLALGTGAEQRAVGRLRDIGHTSGAGLLEGARWALAA